jgi:uncharacterized protein YfaS (alpha-2-macroglobulin family)
VSITSRAPVAGAQIELIAKNGTKLFSQITDKLGHVTLPSAKGYEREQQPVVYVVKQKGDVSFIPYNRYTRQINYSRFNVGGEYAYSADKERVNAYMFTDRRIYRPGETVNIGIIVEGKNLQNLGNIPLELVVGDAQYTEIYVEKIKLAHFGFMDASFKWFTSDTKIPEGIEGNAYVNVAFVRDIASKEIFTSPLSYTVVPFSINRSKRVLDLDLTIENIVQPGQPMAVDLDVSEDAKVAVFALDLGILQVASYRTPDPLAYFLKKWALSARTKQILDLILPVFALSQMLSAAGGDMFADAMMSEEEMVTGRRIKRSQNLFERKVQNPAVFWSAVVIAKKGRNTYTFDVPNDFAGGLRVMAIAVGEQTMGRAQQNTIVRGPFVLTPNVLNHAAPVMNLISP